jgi:FkbM family methyltransferase
MNSAQLLGSLDAKEGEIENARKFFFGGSSFRERVRRFFYPFRYYGLKGFYWLTWLSPRVSKTKLFWGKEISVNLPDSIVMTFYGALSPSELPLTKFLIKNLKDDSVFYDVGSHLGFYTCVAGELIGSGEIHSFEPNPKTFALLRANSDHKNMFPNNMAVSDSVGDREFYADLKRMFGSSSFSPKSSRFKFDKITIHTTTLDAYTKDHKMPTIMKMDVEGVEEEVVRGGLVMFKEKSPVVIMEIWKDSTGAAAHSKAAALLLDLGYLLHGINQDGDLELLETPDHAKNFDSENFVFKKK